MLKRTQIYGGHWKVNGRYVGAATRAIKVITVIFSIPPGLPLPHIRLIDILNTVPHNFTGEMILIDFDHKG